MRSISLIHKWLGLIVGVQLLLWLVSGLIFSLLDPAKVSGRHLAEEQVVQSVMAPAALLSHEAIAGRYASGSVLEIKLIHNLGRPLYRTETRNLVELRDARSGYIFAIDSEVATQIAARDYAGDDRLLGEPVWMDTANLEARKHRGPMWRVDAADTFATSLYISAEDGRVLERRNDTWRLFDFFWMLHTMDYRGRDDFNNPLVVTVGFASLWLVLSGIILLARMFRHRRSSNRRRAA